MCGFKIKGKIGIGAMGTVFLAIKGSQEVALKILNPTDDIFFEDKESRVKVEKNILSKLKHPNIISIIESGKGTWKGAILPYFTMEYIKGKTLTMFLGKNKDHDWILEVVYQIASALEYAHNFECKEYKTKGIIHRDIKPSNIVIYNESKVKVLDFGLGKILGATTAFSLTDTDMLLGTPFYMSREQLENPKNVSEQSDIYSLGVIFYQLLTGELPIKFPQLNQNETMQDRPETMQKLYREELMIDLTSQNIDKKLEAICQKTLYHNIKKRYKSASQLCKDLLNYGLDRRMNWVRELGKTNYSHHLIIDEKEVNLDSLVEKDLLIGLDIYGSIALDHNIEKLYINISIIFDDIFLQVQGKLSINGTEKKIGAMIKLNHNDKIKIGNKTIIYKRSIN